MNTTLRTTNHRYGIVAWLTLAAALSYLCRNAVGVAESTIRTDLKLTLEQSGWFMGAFFWTYAILQVPSGWVSQRYGTRISLAAFAVLWSVASLGIGIAPGFGLLIVGQLVMGTAQAGIFPAACNSIGHWMPLSQRSASCGIMTAGMQVGAISASLLTGALLAPLGWRWVFVVFSIPGIVWAVAFYLKFRDHPDQMPGLSDTERELIRSGKVADELKSTPSETAAQSTSQPLGANHSRSIVAESGISILQNPAIWLLCGQQICRAAGYMFFASWFPTFLQKTRDVSVEDSGYLQSLVLMGSLTGSLVGGMLTDWIWRSTSNLRLSRSGVGSVSLGISAFMILGTWFVADLRFAITLLVLGAIFAAIAGPCGFATTIDLGGNRTPQVFGLMNMCGNLATAACPVVVGRLFEWTANWDLVLLMFAGVYFAGSICWVFVNPKRKVS